MNGEIFPPAQKPAVPEQSQELEHVTIQLHRVMEAIVWDHRQRRQTAIPIAAQVGHLCYHYNSNYLIFVIGDVRC